MQATEAQIAIQQTPNMPTDAYELLLAHMQALNQLLPLQYHRDTAEFPNPEVSTKSQELLAEFRDTRDRFTQERATTESRLNEAYNLIRLYQFQLEQTNRKIEAAEFCIGEARARLRARGLPIYPRPAFPISNTAATPSPSLSRSALTTLPADAIEQAISLSSSETDVKHLVDRGTSLRV